MHRMTGRVGTITALHDHDIVSVHWDGWIHAWKVGVASLVVVGEVET